MVQEENGKVFLKKLQYFFNIQNLQGLLEQYLKR